jgi:nicotinate-nucleotide adenylyltransferase
MAQEARTQLGLDRVVLMPVHTPPHKELASDPGPEARVMLCRLAAESSEGLEVSTLETDRPGPSYTVATLREIHAQRPEDDLTFIVGGDMAFTLPSWREPEELLSLATLAVAERDGVVREDIAAHLAEIEGGRDRIRFFDMPRLDISSSAIRRRVAAGQPIRHLVPEAVAEAIASKGLYSERQA